MSVCSKELLLEIRCHLQASPSVASPLAASSASYPAMSQMASAAGSLQGSSSGAQPPSSLASVTAAMSQMAATTRTLQSHWQAMLSQQGQPVPVEELLDRRLFGNASNETSLMASPVGSVLLVSPCAAGPLLLPFKWRCLAFISCPSRAAFNHSRQSMYSGLPVCIELWT